MDIAVLITEKHEGGHVPGCCLLVSERAVPSAREADPLVPTYGDLMESIPNQITCYDWTTDSPLHMQL